MADTARVGIDTPVRAPTAPTLKRALRLRDVALLYLATTLSVRWVATAAAAGPSSLVVWCCALLGFFVPLAGSVMELSSRYPQEGGLYVWAREEFGEFAGFLSAWTYWMSNLPYFASILYFGAGVALFAAGERGRALSASPGFFMTFAVVWLAVITVVNIVGLDAGKWLNNVGATGTWLPIVILMGLAAVAAERFGVANRFTASAMTPHWSIRDAVFWSTIFMAFSGCETGSFMGEEIENPRRTIPRALLVAGVVLALAYGLGTAALLVAVPSAQVSGVDGLMQGVATLCGRFGWSWLTVAMAGLLALGAVGGAAAYLSSTSRLPFVAGLDLYLPPVFGRVHSRFRTPWVAIGVYGLAGMAMAALGQAGTTVRGAYDAMVSMTIITTFLPFLVVFAAMATVQSRPAGGGVMRVPGGRPVALALAAVGFVSTAATIVLAGFPPEEEPHKALAVAKVLVLTLVLVGGGAAVFRIGEKKRQRIAGQQSVRRPDHP
ncbi:MAG TPA: APC family permease [Acidobacteriaceae bacterium]|nr:APC family permease [Acidobacteriaceae bacterium]